MREVESFYIAYTAGEHMKRLLIFDAYGTLISTGNGSIEATEKILSLQEKQIDATVFYKDWKKYHRRHLDEANKTSFLSEEDIFMKDLEALYKRYQINRPYEEDVQIMLNSLENRIVFPEVVESINQLRKKYRVVIGSTTDTEPLLKNLTSNNLVVDKVYTSEMIQKYKPDKHFYQYILQCEGYEPEEAVFIGDSLKDDIEGPQSVGITTVLVDRKNTLKSDEYIQPDFVVKDISEIEKICL